MPGNETSKMKSRLTLVAGAAAMGLGVLIMMAFSGRSVGDSARQEVDAGPLVETIAPEPAAGRYVIEAPGRLRSRQALNIVAEVAGKVSYVNPLFVLGGRLDQGDVLFKINAADFEADAASARAAVTSAEAMVKRARLDNDRRAALVKSEAVSEAARDEAVANLASAEASLQQAKAQLQRAEENLARVIVRAPFPALVISEDVSLDTYVAPGQSLGLVIDTRLGEIVAGLAPADAAAVARAVKASSGPLEAVARPNDGSVGSGKLVGMIDQFSPAIDEASRTALVVATFPDAFAPENTGQVFANDFMTLQIEVDAQQQVWCLPAGSVRKNTYVWLMDDGTIKRQNVNVLNTEGDHVFITADVPLNDRQVMLTLLSEEVDGMRVQAEQARTELAAANTRANKD